MALNNEVSILNIANIDNDIKDASTRAMIAGEEVMEYATHNYVANQYFIWNDRKLYKTLQAISVGSNFVVDVNVHMVGTLCSQLYELYSQSPETIRNLISNVEDTPNSSRAYSLGEYIIRDDGNLYRVVTNLSLGTLWRVGTNIVKVDNVTKLINDLEVADRQTRNMIAFVEDTNVASRTYVKGERFIFDNQLVEATANIAKNATITLNGNCASAGNVMTQMGKWLQVQFYLPSTVACAAQSNTQLIHLVNFNTLTVDTSAGLDTLPTGAVVTAAVPLWTNGPLAFQDCVVINNAVSVSVLNPWTWSVDVAKIRFLLHIA